MKRLLLVFIMLATVLAAPAQRRQRQQRRQPTQREQLQQQQRRVQQQRQANQQRQRELERQVTQRMKDVEALGSEIDDKLVTIDSLRHDIDTVNHVVAVLDSQLVVLQNELEERRQHYIKSLRYMYRNRNVQNQMMFVFSAQNFNQMYRRMRFMNEYTTYQRAQAEAVKQKSEQVGMKLAELNKARDQLTALLARSEQEQRLLEDKKAEQQRMVADLQKEQRTVQKLIQQQQQEEAALNAQIERLIAEELERARKAEEERQRRLAEQRRREEEQRQRQQQQRQQAANNNRHGSRNRNRSNNTTTTNTATATNTTTTTAYAPATADQLLSGSFASNKGRLPVPITGSYRIIRGFGPYTLAGVTLQSSGIHLEGRDGAQARCVFEGEVSKIYNPGTGYFVMVRHGRYISVYGNLSSVSVTQGQKVKTNQVLGTVGASHILVFRLQNWEKLLNPKQWISRM